MIKSTDRIFAALAGLLFAAAIIYLAAPRTIAAFKAFDGDATVAALAAGENPAMDDLRDLVLNRTEVLRWANNPGYVKDLSRAYHSLVPRVAIQSRRSVVVATRTASIAELSLRPLDGAAWWRLAVMEDLNVLKPSRQAAVYLWRSVLIEPNALDLTPRRLRLIVDNWSQFEPDEQRVLGAHVADLWKRHRNAVVKMAVGPLNRGILRAALAPREDILGQFEAELAAIDKRSEKTKF